VQTWRESLESAEEVALRASIRDTKLEISKLSVVADFVARSRLERKVVKMEKDLTTLQASAKSKSDTAISRVLSRYALPVVYVFLVIVFWNTPIATLPSAMLGPLGYPLAMPGWSRGTIGIIGWMTLSHSAVPRLLKVVLPKPREDPSASKGIMAQALNALKAFK
jgi:hypothetical protein